MAESTFGAGRKDSEDRRVSGEGNGPVEIRASHERDSEWRARKRA